jgi:hypothetical protein
MTNINQVASVITACNRFKTSRNETLLKNTTGESVRVLNNALDSKQTLLTLDDSLQISELHDAIASGNFQNIYNALIELSPVCEKLSKDVQLLHYCCLYATSMAVSSTETAYLEKAREIGSELKTTRLPEAILSFEEKLALFSHKNGIVVWILGGWTLFTFSSGGMLAWASLVLTVIMFYGKVSYGSKHKASIEQKLQAQDRQEQDGDIVDRIQKLLNS